MEPPGLAVSAPGVLAPASQGVPVELAELLEAAPVPAPTEEPANGATEGAEVEEVEEDAIDLIIFWLLLGVLLDAGNCSPAPVSVGATTVSAGEVVPALSLEGVSFEPGLEVSPVPGLELLPVLVLPDVVVPELVLPELPEPPEPVSDGVLFTGAACVVGVLFLVVATA